MLLSGPAVQAQLGPTSQYELSDSIYLDEADSAARRHLTQVDAFLAAGQWDEAIESLRQISSEHGDKMVKLVERRYLNVRAYCQLQFCRMPAEALALYRSRVDSQAREWFEAGAAQRDQVLLRRVVEQFFASSSGDDALDALAEMWLEEGDYGAARAAWRRLVPREAGMPADSAGVTTAIAYPQTDLDPGRLLARLTLVSILEGDLPRAERELEELRQHHPGSMGRLGGREVNYVKGLAKLLEDSREWKPVADDLPWSTFGGSPERTKVMPVLKDVGAYQWSVPLLNHASEPLAMIAHGASQSRPAESHGRLLSYYPLVAGNLVLVNDDAEIRAYDLATGKPAFSNAVIFSAEESDSKFKYGARQHRPRHLGVPRFTMTVHGNKLFARMGSSITAVAPEINPQVAPGYLVCLDLAAQGRLLWRLEPGAEKWAFEGSPICDGKNVYVAMRRSDVRPQAHVACFDAETGQERWRRFICAAETPGRGQINECTHNLLTLHRGMLYLNTNLGAVAALSCQDGRVSWISLYRRTTKGDLSQPASHVYRDLNPCIYDRGRLFVAPSDSEFIFAFDADSGDLLWDSRSASGAVHLLGVGNGTLFVSGERLAGFNAETGKFTHEFQQERGYGRGALVGDSIYFPVREGSRFALRIVDQRLDKQGKTRSIRTISLNDKATNVKGEQEEVAITSGNLLVAGDRLLVTTSESIMAFGQYSRTLDRAPKQTSLGRVAERLVADVSAPQPDGAESSFPRRRSTAPRVSYRPERN
ncbi:MAG: PQQ-binding-like beta-propeller repeat protein [Pirellulales bacterium]|nr:PQQ-binding-like beta-propeller repeat protein [Pirellulales bacterium]